VIDPYAHGRGVVPARQRAQLLQPNRRLSRVVDMHRCPAQRHAGKIPGFFYAEAIDGVIPGVRLPGLYLPPEPGAGMADEYEAAVVAPGGYLRKEFAGQAVKGEGCEEVEAVSGKVLYSWLELFSCDHWMGAVIWSQGHSD